MAVGFGKDKCFRHFVFAFFIHSIRKNLCLQSSAKFSDNGSDLANVYHLFIQIVLGVFRIFIFLLPAFFACQLITAVNIPAGFDYIAFFGYFGFNGVNFLRYVHTIGYRFFVAVLAYHIFIEKTKSPLVGRGGQSDYKSIEIV
ncbi:MAG: hypothetical protein BWZ00_01899 [Bacteroidetes bacterium ADurb.BinA174]|nr:MAG: hypothetical protein BWZ00_01899 [Bacteroidetes bacterium ADurb.BinA174]